MASNKHSALKLILKFTPPILLAVAKVILALHGNH